MRPQSIILLLCVSTFLGCTLTDSELKKGWWKHGSGYSIGDVIYFNGRHVRNDTIIINDRPIAVIKSRKRTIIGDDNEIIIKSLHTNETGIYYQK